MKQNIEAPDYSDTELFYLANYKNKSNKDMDLELGLKRRMGKVGNNLRKFGQLDGEEAKTQPYHNIMIADGLDFIATTGVKKYCRNLGMLYGISEASVKSDYATLKRYKVIKK